MIDIGTLELADIAIGGTPIEKAYIDSTLVWEKSAPVPKYDAQVEWLSSTGGQYIQLPLTVPKATFFQVEFDCIPVYLSVSYNNRYGIFGGSPYQQCECSFYSGSASAITYGSYLGTKNASGAVGVTPDVKNHVIFSTTQIHTYTEDGDITNRSVARPLTANITAFRVFGAYRYANYRYPIKYCNFKITVGDNLVYDLIAVRKDGVGYMYDKISGNLLGNSGSGSFTYGDDII